MLEAICSTLNFRSVCQVSVEFSPTSAVPGEETTLKVKALPDSLCGVSAIDQSVLVKEPGKTLTAEQVIGSTKFNQKGLEFHSDHPEGHFCQTEQTLVFISRCLSCCL